MFFVWYSIKMFGYGFSNLPANSVILPFPTYGNQITLISTEEEANPIQTKNEIHPSIARAQLNAGIFGGTPCFCPNISSPILHYKF